MAVRANVIGLPAPEPERYRSRAELAELMGVSVATVDRMVADGMPSETWGRRTRRFRPSVALAWARSRQYAAEQHQAPPRRLEPPGGLALGDEPPMSKSHATAPRAQS